MILYVIPSSMDDKYTFFFMIYAYILKIQPYSTCIDCKVKNLKGLLVNYLDLFALALDNLN